MQTANFIYKMSSTYFVCDGSYHVHSLVIFINMMGTICGRRKLFAVKRQHHAKMLVEFQIREACQLLSHHPNLNSTFIFLGVSQLR